MKINVNVFDIIIGILLTAWLVSIVRGSGGFIHILLMFALAILSMRIARYRREHQE
ncbi:MAG: hypothetical protein MSG64_04735 [Pyrinomonadaceae bacterium MAG19_C2-C3]|nr:hypothetical protein [Pyrinomonadaceae bacterium MAG19_C2-C3]